MKKKNKNIQVGIVALILLSFQHFSPRQLSFSSLTPDFLHRFCLISVPFSFSLDFVSPDHLI